MKKAQKPIEPKAFVEALYRAFLRRNASPQELATKLGQLAGETADLSAMVETFLVAPEYIQRIPQIAQDFGPLRRSLNSDRLTIFSIGLPGAFSDWCEAAATFAAGFTHTNVDVLGADTPAELGMHSLKSKAGCVTVCSRQPDRHLLRALKSGDRPFLVSTESPRSVIAYLVSKHGWDLPKSIRAASSSYATLMQFRELPNALVLHADQSRDEPSLVMQIADHFGLRLSAEELTAVLSTLHKTQRQLSKDWLVPWWDQLANTDQALIDGALSPYTELLDNPDADARFTWGRELFVRTDHPVAPLTDPIDITGRARCLVHGPGVLIPPGTWTARIVIGFSKEAVGMSFVVEAVAGKALGQSRLQPNRAGIIQTDINFTIDPQGPAFGHTFQIRLTNERAAFDGRIAIGDVTLSRQARIRPEIEREIAETLHLTQ